MISRGLDQKEIDIQNKGSGANESDFKTISDSFMIYQDGMEQTLNIL